eukprot:EG_transcript_24555
MQRKMMKSKIPKKTVKNTFEPPPFGISRTNKTHVEMFPIPFPKSAICEAQWIKCHKWTAIKIAPLGTFCHISGQCIKRDQCIQFELALHMLSLPANPSVAARQGNAGTTVSLPRHPLTSSTS